MEIVREETEWDVHVPRGKGRECKHKHGQTALVAVTRDEKVGHRTLNSKPRTLLDTNFAYFPVFTLQHVAAGAAARERKLFLDFCLL